MGRRYEEAGKPASCVFFLCFCAGVLAWRRGIADADIVHLADLGVGEECRRGQGAACVVDCSGWGGGFSQPYTGLEWPCVLQNTCSHI